MKILLAKKQFLQQFIGISEKKIKSFNGSLSPLSHNFDGLWGWLSPAVRDLLCSPPLFQNDRNWP